MCIAVWIWQANPRYPLILLLNRDELHDRPTKPVGWWGWDGRKILGGRDVQAGGTWMGCTRDGRLAFLTNVLEPDTVPFAKSRGDLPVRFLESEKTPLEFAEDVNKEAEWYNGFNLILSDLSTNSMVYVSNRPKGEVSSIQMVSPGLHVLTNARLDTPWHKAQRLRKSFRDILHKYGESELPFKEIVEKLMCDKVKAKKDKLPNTGCDSDLEHKLSSIFIETETEFGLYGTRSQAALSVTSSGEVNLYERYLEENIWREHTVKYQME